MCWKSTKEMSATVFLDFRCWRWFCCFAVFPLPWSLSGLLNQQNIWFGKAGRRAQSWLVTCSFSNNALSIWAPSSRLSFKRRLLMGRQPEESNGICREILHSNRCKESHKTKHRTKINVLSANGVEAWELWNINTSKLGLIQLNVISLALLLRPLLMWMYLGSKLV